MTYATGRAALNRVTRERFRRHCRPLPRLSMSQWAERYRVLSAEASARHGPWRNDVAPYMAEVMDAISDRVTQEITVIAPSQSAKSEGCVLNPIGYFIHQEPSPIIVVQPTTETGESFSKDRIAPMLRDCKALSKLVRPAKSRDGNNTISSKALALDTPIPTPAGWSSIGSLSVGDFVYGDDGLPCVVTAKSDVAFDHPCYRVTFSDGTEITADAGHLWRVEWWQVAKTPGEKARQTRQSGVLTTEYMATRVRQGRRYRFSVRNAAPLDGPDVPLPVDPYVLGVWLGDGNSNNTRVTAHEADAPELAENIEACGYSTQLRHLRGQTYSITIDPRIPTAQAGSGGRFVASQDGLGAKLRAIGLTRPAGTGPSRKHIPACYLRASRRQRVALLQGLMDTDGTATKSGAMGVFVTVLPGLWEGFTELLSSLGIKHRGRMRKCHATIQGQRHAGRDAMQFAFALPVEFEVFRLRRKAQRQRDRSCAGIRAQYRRVTAITPTDPVAVQCITVSNATHLFLAGRSMIPTHNSYPGGQLDIVGANAPSGLAMRPKRVVLLDERDRHPRSAGKEGDVKAIVRARTASFEHRRKIVEVSSPTDEASSLIHPSYLEGTQEVLQAPCTHCGHLQALEFARLKYKIDEATKQVDRASVHYECAACETPIPATARKAMMRAARFVSQGVARVPFKRSFWIGGLLAAFASWPDLAQEFVTANSQPDPALRAEMLRAFFNTRLGVLYKDQQKEAQKERLSARAKRYDGTEGDGPRRFQVPMRAAILTAGVDVQHDRTEWIVRAWGVGEESWLIERVVLRGDTSQPDYWARFDEERLSRRWKHEGGADLAIRAMCIDAGDGTHSKTIYTYCAPRLHQHVFAIKGSSNPEAPMLPKKFTQVKPGRLYVLGVNAMMHRTYLRLGADTPGPGFLHLNEYADDDYLTQLLSMRRVVDPKTRKRKWEATAGVPNEVADGEVYALAALQLGPVPVTALAAEVDRVVEAGKQAVLPTTAPPVPVTPTPARSSWLGGPRKGWI